MELNPFQGQTIATPPTEILKILTLQKRDNCLEAIESYYKRVRVSGSAPSNIVTSRVLTLFFDLEAALKRSVKSDEFKLLMIGALSDNIDESIGAFRNINQWLDEKKITTMDVRQRIDTRNVENENFEKGL